MPLPLALLVGMRPRQWTKNLILLAPLIFAGRLLDPASALRSVAAFGLFCLVAGSVYLVNDIKDAERDRLHEVKRTRPVASGALSPARAAFAAGALVLGGLVASYLLAPGFCLVVGVYLVQQTLYTFYLKNEVLLDVMSIAAGFVLRATAGALVIDARQSPWLITCAALLALFLGFAKRRHELVVLDRGSGRHRPVLEHYNEMMLDSLLSTVSSATIVTYGLYTFFSHSGQEAYYLMLTIPFVAYGLFRYLYLVHLKNLGGSPEEILLTDKPLIVNIVLWLASVAAILYLT